MNVCAPYVHLSVTINRFGGPLVPAPASLQASDWPLHVPAGHTFSESQECSPVVHWLEHPVDVKNASLIDLTLSRAMLDLAFIFPARKRKH